MLFVWQRDDDADNTISFFSFFEFLSAIHWHLFLLTIDGKKKKSCLSIHCCSKNGQICIDLYGTLQHKNIKNIGTYLTYNRRSNTEEETSLSHLDEHDLTILLCNLWPYLTSIMSSYWKTQKIALINQKYLKQLMILTTSTQNILF